MYLAGQKTGRPPRAPRCTRLDEGGYVLAVLLIGMAVAAIWMSALLPAWRQQAMREKEAELIFRGEQYERAIALYMVKNEMRRPPNIDILLSQHYLREKYLDPITGKEFFYMGAPGIQNLVQTPTGGRGLFTPPSGGQTAAPPPAGTGVYGVRSTSTDTSIRIYRGQQQYNLWEFRFENALSRGVGGRGRGAGTGVGPGAGQGGRPGGGGLPGVGTPGSGAGRDGRAGGRGIGSGGGRGGGELPPIGGRGPTGGPPPTSRGAGS